MTGGHVLVIGAGIVGITTAYDLLSRGFDTTLVEARTGVGLETSYANGGLLTPAMSDPWNAPGIHRILMRSLLDRDSAFRIRPSKIISLARWGVRFLWHSKAQRHMVATHANFALGKYSVDCTRELRRSLNLEDGTLLRGTLKVFRNKQAMKRARALATDLETTGLRFVPLDPKETIKLEPALEGIQSGIAGALHFPDDASADAYQFCEGLTAAFRRRGGILLTGVRVSRISVERGRVTGVDSTMGRLSAPRVIVAAGNCSAHLVKHLGSVLSIRPVKGYTLTFDTSKLTGCPGIAVIDDELHFGVTPLGSRLRLAGTAEFAGNDRNVEPQRVDYMMRLMASLYPDIASQLDPSKAVVWTGLRPVSADGLPFVGPTTIRGLYLNAGHGHLGWTLAAGSARLLGSLLADEPAQIDPTPYLPGRGQSHATNH